VPQAADFVQQSRTGPTDFIPVGVTPPARALPTRKPDEVATMQSSLEATRSQHDAIGGRDPNAGSTLAEQAKPRTARARHLIRVDTTSSGAREALAMPAPEV
jgi:hypothetical protein